MKVTVLGLDTGMANGGWVILQMRATQKASVILDAGVVSTERSAKKLNVKAGDDDFERSREIAKVMLRLVEQYKPTVVTCEAFSPPRNASATGKIGRCFGVLACLSVVHDLPVVHATPQEIKKAMCGAADASKEDVAAVVSAMWSNLTATLEAAGVPPSKREHAYDAAASILTCWDRDVMRFARKGAQ